MTRQAITSGLRPDHFALLAPSWSDYGPPLRPSPADTAVVQQCADRLPAGARVLVLGLTPETIGCRWPDGTRLLAVDHSAAMLRMLWPHPGAPAGAQAVRAPWEQLPLPDGTMDLVCGDGCQIAMHWPAGIGTFHREVRRVLAPDGRFVTRMFIRPEVPEPLAAIGADLAAGRIGSVHALKLRMLAAMHGSSGPGTCLDDVWHAWKTLPPHPQPPEQRGWTERERATMERHQGLQTRYFPPTLAELRSQLAQAFEELACSFGDYELAERCPTLVMRPRRGG